MKDIAQVSIVGVGLIGGSLGLAVRALPDPPMVVGVARRQATVDEAVALGAIERGTTDLAEGVADADVVFIATPVRSVVDLVAECAKVVRPGTIITDVGSTKAGIVRQAEKAVGGDVHFIGGHPMAGSERHGVAAASATLFRNAHYLLTPTEATDALAFKRLHELLTAIGAHVLALDPDKHDRFVAAVSHLPHLVAASLINAVVKQSDKTRDLLLLAAGGFRDTTRIAASNPEMWMDIFQENREALAEVLESYLSEVAETRRLIASEDWAGLRAKLEQAQQARAALPAALEIDETRMRDLLVPVTDRPGVLSEVTLTIGRLGINIEDIEILHTSDTAGVLKLTVGSQEHADRAAKALRDKGYEVEIARR